MGAVADGFGGNKLRIRELIDNLLQSQKIRVILFQNKITDLSGGHGKGYTVQHIQNN